MEDFNNYDDQSTKDDFEQDDDDMILQFLDSVDNYISLYDSLSSSLRQGWLDLASARHSMGISRVTRASFDLKLHSASSTIEVNPTDGSRSGIMLGMKKQPLFSLSKWGYLINQQHISSEVNEKLEMQKKSNTSELRHRGSQNSDGQEKKTASNEALNVDDQIQKERSKALSVFGKLISPKLRMAQISFETALESLVEIANARSLMLSSFARLKERKIFVDVQGPE